MRTPFVAMSTSLGLIVVAFGAAPSTPRASATEAGKAVETLGRWCTAHQVYRAAPGTLGFDCAVVYRNGSNRPVFDLKFEATFDGRPFRSAPGYCCPGGTRRALAPGEEAIWLNGISLSYAGPDAAPPGPYGDRLAIRYEASWDGPASALDVPRPELQYVDVSAPSSGHASVLGEARNADGRPWRSSPDGGRDDGPVVALFQGHALVGADTSRRDPYREPSGRIDPDSRYAFRVGVDYDAWRGFDAVRVFWREAFAEEVPSGFTPAHLELTGLDHHLDDFGLHVRVTARNTSPHIADGEVMVFARRADFHVIATDRCLLVAVAPGAEASCDAGPVMFGGADPGTTLADVRFVTVDLGGALGRLPTPTPTATATECPRDGPTGATPQPAATLAAVAGRVWLPWANRLPPDRCP